MGRLVLPGAVSSSLHVYKSVEGREETYEWNCWHFSVFYSCRVRRRLDIEALWSRR
jgi:hypothetical protein